MVLLQVGVADGGVHVNSGGRVQVQHLLQKVDSCEHVEGICETVCLHVIKLQQVGLCVYVMILKQVCLCAYVMI